MREAEETPLKKALVTLAVALLRLAGRVLRWLVPYEAEQIVIKGSSIPTSDISAHLPALYWETVRSRPQVLVELGVRGGRSTEIFIEAGKRTATTIISVDMDTSSFSTDYPKWHFFQSRSQDLALRFEEVCRELRLEPSIDLLFLDTSHLYAQTVEELKLWTPWLSQSALLIFHDTNMKRIIRRSDGSFQLAWNNDGGVVRAIKEVLGVDLEPTQWYVGTSGPWVVRHTPRSSGLTILHRTAH